jgi:glucuronate isomerase
MSSQQFITDDFMLHNESARRLYHDYAEGMPIIDYHCHLPIQDVADDTRWENLTQVWLYGDHYKWRAMRSNGVPERFCTGDATDREKFDKWAETMPYLLRNPLYHWTQLELARYFDVYELLSPATAQHIWDTCNEKLAGSAFTARGLMIQSNVTHACTTDDPVDSLEYHTALAADHTFPVTILPTWRPDKGMAVENPEMFNTWVDRLVAAANVDVRDFSSYRDALRKRHDFFHTTGCRLSDHGIETAYAEEYTEAEICEIFSKVRSGTAINDEEILKFKSAMLYEFGIMDHEKNWTQQYHLGPIRNTNTRMFALLGPDTGFDSIGDKPVAQPLAKLLDRLAHTDQLAQTILYNINPRDNALLATMIGNFQDGSVPGKMQFGSGWWFLDQEDGMREQINILSRLGLLSRFVGMLTDSRSFLSYTRHEYFRRILCNILGEDMEQGTVPQDYTLVGEMVGNICYGNAKRYFGFKPAAEEQPLD